MAKIGVFFGSFDPIHNGHLTVVKQAFDENACDQIKLIVQPRNAYKLSKSQAALADRVKMAELATTDLEYVDVSPLDPLTPLEHSVVFTLRNLKNLDQECNLVLLLGRDLATTVVNWPDYAQIISLCTIFEAHRSAEDASSGQVRDLIKNSLSTDQFLPQPVADYIRGRGLYS